MGVHLRLSTLLGLLAVASTSGQAAAQTNSSAAEDEQQPRNNRVLIGLLTQNSDPSPRGQSYIAASYIKFLEAAGARVVPFLHDLPKHEIKRRCSAPATPGMSMMALLLNCNQEHLAWMMQVQHREWLPHPRRRGAPAAREHLL